MTMARKNILKIPPQSEVPYKLLLTAILRHLQANKKETLSISSLPLSFKTANLGECGNCCLKEGIHNLEILAVRLLLHVLHMHGGVLHSLLKGLQEAPSLKKCPQVINFCEERAVFCHECNHRQPTPGGQYKY